MSIEEKNVYYSFSSYLKKRFDSKVRKIVVNAGFTCPNRDGSKSTGGCTFCNEKGSGSGSVESIQKQVQSQIDRLSLKNIKKYMVYFQSFTNTYAPVNVLKQRYDASLIDDRIVALAVGTRPDCVDEQKIALLQSYTDKYEVWVEYGLQSIHQKSLDRINRGHSKEDFVKAVEMTANKNIKICVHIIVGLPDESYNNIMATAKFVAGLPIDAIKIHSLYIEKGTKLYDEFINRPFKIFSKEEYVKIVCDILEILPENMIIQRLTGDPSEDFVAPEWGREKSTILRMIKEELIKRQSRQGIFWKYNFKL